MAAADVIGTPAASGPGTPHSTDAGPRGLRLLRRTFPRVRLLRIAVTAVVLVAVAWFFLYLGQIRVYNLTVAQVVFGPITQGFTVTLELIAIVIPIGFTMGFLMGWARTTQSPLLRGIGAVYVDFFRSMPPLALILFAFLLTLIPLHQIAVSPSLQKQIPQLLGAIALALHSGAYQAEIFRAGILSVPTGQHEAADAIGLTRWQAMFRVVFPQAVRVSLPPLGNEFSSVIKDTSLLSAIGVFDLSGIGQTIIFQTSYAYRYPVYLTALIIWFEIAILYFIITFALNRVVRGVENRYKVPGLEAAQG